MADNKQPIKLTVGQQMLYAHSDEVPGNTFKAEVIITKILADYDKCWVKVTRVIEKGPLCSIMSSGKESDFSIIVNIDDLSLL